MVTSDQIHKLIKSLTPNEIRYIQIYLSKLDIGNSDLLSLFFKRTLQQQVYNENIIKSEISQLKRKVKVALLKNQLQEIIYDALISYSKNHSFDALIHKRLETERLLRDKGHYALARKELKKAKKEATKNDRHFLLLEILHRERSLTMSSYSSESKRLLDTNKAEIIAVEEKIKSEDEYDQLFNISYSLFEESGELNTHELAKKLNFLLNNPLLLSETKLITFETHLKFHLTWCNCYRLKGDYQKLTYHRTKVVDLWKLYPERIQKHTRRYQSSLTNLLNSQHLLGYYDEFEKKINEIIKFNSNPKEWDISTFKSVNYLLFILYIHTGKLDEAIALSNCISKKLKEQYEDFDISGKMVFYIDFALLYFITGNNSKALKYLKEIIDLPHTNIREDICAYARVLQLILFYNSDSFETMEYACRATNRFLKKVNRLGLFEKSVIKHLRLLSNCNNTNEKNNLFKKLKTELQEINEYNEAGNILGFEEIMCWINSELNNTPLRETFIQYVTSKRITKRDYLAIIDN